jgi:hypothetical protein
MELNGRGNKIRTINRNRIEPWPADFSAGLSGRREVEFWYWKNEVSNSSGPQRETVTARSVSVEFSQMQTNFPSAGPASDRIRRSDSLIVSSFPPLFDEFHGKRFVFVWRGSRDDLAARDFHGRCDGHANTLTLIFDTGGLSLTDSRRWKHIVKM